MMRQLLAWILLTTLFGGLGGCDKSKETSESEESEEGAFVPEEPSDSTGSAGEGDAEEVGVEEGASKPADDDYTPNPIEMKTICGTSGLLLTQHAYEELAGGKYCELCREFDEMACELDWPSSDVMQCPEYDIMRNTIYARYGKAFRKPMWQRYFAGKPWYRAAGDFSQGRLSAVATSNVAYLKKTAKECKARCREHLGPDECPTVKSYLKAL